MELYFLTPAFALLPVCESCSSLYSLNASSLLSLLGWCLALRVNFHLKSHTVAPVCTVLLYLGLAMLLDLLSADYVIFLRLALTILALREVCHVPVELLCQSLRPHASSSMPLGGAC